MRRRLRNTFSSDENAQDQPSADAERQQDAAITSDGGATFQFTTWTVFVVQVWLLDFGRPFFSLYLPGDASLSALSISDYAHMAYNYVTALCVIKLQDSSSIPVSRIVHQMLLVSFVIGASIHMVADAVQHRLLRAGAKLHLTIQEQPILQNAQHSLVESLHLLDYLDEHLGHQLWYLALYLLFLLYFSSCFYTTHPDTSTDRAPKTKQMTPHPLSSAVFCVLLFLSGLHEWYAVTEAQVFPHFVAVSLAMLVVFTLRLRHGGKIDANGVFLLLRSILTLLLVAVWVAVLWRDSALREKYRGNWLFIPEPWSYASLYLMNHTQ